MPRVHLAKVAVLLIGTNDLGRVWQGEQPWGGGGRGASGRSRLSARAWIAQPLPQRSQKLTGDRWTPPPPNPTSPTHPPTTADSNWSARAEPLIMAAVPQVTSK